MATAAVRGMYAAIRRSDPDRPDADLLRQFASVRDEEAFTELVRRHGPLVLGVCRRVIGDPHQADDAFQAVFVVLANKAGRLGADRPLGPWLYGVAFRVALRARAMIGRRRKRETLAAVLPEVAVHPAAEDASAVIDEEIDRLSAVCREALVLCELQGVSRRDAAKRLGIAEGTLSSRLAAAKKALAERLRERGVALGVGVTLPAVSSHLLAATVAVSTGRAELTPHLLNLIHGATHMGLLGKLKVMAVGVLVVLLSVGGFGLIPSAESNAAPVPKATDDGLIWTHNIKTGVLTAYTPDGKKANELTLKDGSGFLGLTPDGKQILFAGRDGQATNTIVARNLTLHLRGLSADEKGTDTGLTIREHDQFVFSPDGKQIIRQRRDDLGQAKPAIGYFHVLFDMVTKKETAIDLPMDHQIVQWATDGKTWRVMHHNNGVDPKLPAWRWLTTPASGQPDLKPICDAGSFNWLEPDADGNTFFGAGEEHPAAVRGVQCLFRVTDGKPEVLTKFDRVAFANIRRSPDRRRVVCAKNEYDTKTWDWGDTAFVLFDSDGKNERKLVTFENDQQSTRLLGWFPAKSDARRKNAPVPKATPPEGLLVLTSFSPKRPIEIIKPDGESVRVLDQGANVWNAKLSPDGKRLVFEGFLPAAANQPPKGGWGELTLSWLDLEAKVPEVQTIAERVACAEFAWAPDGQTLYFSHLDPAKIDDSSKPGEVMHFQTSAYHFPTKKKTQVKLPSDQTILDVSRDGKTFLTRSLRCDSVTHTVSLVPLATLKPEVLIRDDPAYTRTRFGPDGRRLVLARYSETDPGAKTNGVFLFDLATKKETQIRLPKELEDAHHHEVCCSPDGKRIAIHWSEDIPQPRNAPIPAGPLPPGKSGWTAGRVTVCDVDGKNAQTVVKREYDVSITGFVWAAVKLPEGESPPDARKKNAPVPKANADPGVVWVYNWQTGKLLAYRPNGDKLKEYTLPYQSRFHGLTPDGKRFVYAAEPGGKVPDKPNLFNGKLTLHTREVGDDTPATDLGVEEHLAAPVVWAPDGKKFYRFDQATTASPKHLLTVFDATGKEEKQIELQGNWPIGWGPDGTSVMLSTMYRMKPPKTTTVSRLTLASGKTEKLFEGDYFDLPQLSPDGKLLLGFDNFSPTADDVRPNTGVLRYDLATGKLTDVVRREKQGYATGLWSPDSNRVAYRWCEVKPNKSGTRDGDWHFVVSDADGKNEVKLFTDPQSSTAISTMVVAWTPTPSVLKDVSLGSRK